MRRAALTFIGNLAADERCFRGNWQSPGRFLEMRSLAPKSTMPVGG